MLAASALAQQPRPSGGSIKMPPPPQASAPAPAATDRPLDTAEWMALPIDDLRRRAHGGETRAMEELARRLVAGIGVPQDAQSGAGWLLRAAEAGSPGAAFNVGVMYERGFVVERDSTKAVEWYQKAVDGNIAVAKHNLALLLREGRGAPRDGKRALELLQSAARQGMAASMFSLGDIYERGDAAPKDAPLAMAWFAVALEFERQRGQGTETPLARNALQRLDALKQVLTPAELGRAQKLGELEYNEIVAALAPKPEAAPPLPPLKAPPADSDEAIGWPRTAIERVRAVQQALIDLNRLRGQADGVAGAQTRAAIRDFEKSAGLIESGEPSRDVYVALLRALQAQRDTVARSPLPPPPPKSDAPKAEPPKPPEVKVETAPPPPPPTSADIARAAPKPEPAKPEPKPEPAKPAVAKVEAAPAAAKPEPKPAPPPPVELGKPEPPPAPPTSTDIARAMPDPDGWPANRVEQIRALQALLAELKLVNFPPTGELGPQTLTALRDFQRKAGLGESGEPSRALFLKLKAQRDAAAQSPAPPSPPPELGKPEQPPPPPTTADLAKTAAAVPPPSAPAKPDPNPWPAGRTEQVRAIQALLRDLKLMDIGPTGHVGPLTIAAIRDYQRMAGLPVTGELSKELFDSLKEMRAMTESRASGKPR